MSEEFSVGQRLGDYEILGVLGSGGMGKVYKVSNVISDRVEAMKVLLPNLAGQKDLADRFLREIKLLATLNHPNIVALRTALTLDNQLMLIMEYVEGKTLASRLQEGPIPAPEAVAYADQVLGALSYAHKLNVIHRDIKPGNMMLTPEGIVKLMDFGIARPGDEAGMTVTGTTLGSLNYMPPEQVKGEPVDGRSDIYSLGVSLYEMVTGQLPFTGPSSYSLMSAHLEEAPKFPIVLKPDLPKALNEIILIAMAKKPEDRFQSADAFRNALKTVFPAAALTLAPEAAPIPVPKPASPVQPPTRAAAVAAAPASSTSPIPAPAARPAAPAPASRPASQPVAAAPPSVSPPPPVPASSHRGVYMALGGLLVVAGLFAAGLYLPHRARTHAGSNSPTPPEKSGFAQPAAPPANPPTEASPEPAPSAVSTPNAEASTEPATPPANAAAPAETERRAAPPKPMRNRVAAQQNASPAPSPSAPAPAPIQSAPPQSAAKPSPQASPANAAELDDLATRGEQLSSRAAAVSQSIQTLQRQQAAQGYGLRGDIVASHDRMQTDLSNAQSALQQQDTAKAKKYLDMAEAEVEKLEKFLGR